MKFTYGGQVCICFIITYFVSWSRKKKVIMLHYTDTHFAEKRDKRGIQH